jgi:GH24 family phage-related lysozyme (muramidase)
VLADGAGASGAVAQSLVPPPGAEGESGAQTSVPVVAQAGANGPPLVSPNTGQPYPDGVHSEGGWLVDGKGALADPDTGRALAYASNGRPDLSHAVHRPGPTERDPVIAQIAAAHPGMNPPGLVVDPETGVMKRYVPGKPGAGPTLVPVTADEQQQGINWMLGVKNDGFAPGQMSQVELNLRTPPPGTSAGRISVPSWFPQGTSGAAATSPLSDRGAEWLKGREKNSVIMTPDIAHRQYSITQFDDASKTYIDSSGHRTFGYGHVLTDADARDGLTVASLSQMTPAEKQDLADRLFTQDVQTHFNNVAARLGQATISQLRPNQVDALIGDDFNAGSNAALGTNMIQAIRRGDDQGAAGEFNAWHTTDRHGRHMLQRGLVPRNLEEQAIWTNGDYRLVPDSDPRVAAIVAREGRSRRQQ